VGGVYASATKIRAIPKRRTFIMVGKIYIMIGIIINNNNINIAVLIRTIFFQYYLLTHELFIFAMIDYFMLVHDVDSLGLAASLLIFHHEILTEA